MEPHLDFIVKLGGSAITRKEQLECAITEHIQLVANVLSASRQAGNTFLVVHGAGYVLQLSQSKTLHSLNYIFILMKRIKGSVVITGQHTSL